jgi:hypothetical protein
MDSNYLLDKEELPEETASQALDRSITLDDTIIRA